MATQAEVARHLDLTSRRIRELVEDGVLPRAGRAGLALDDCRVRYIRWLRDRQQTTGGLDPSAERARKDKEAADKLALENSKARGDLVNRAEVLAAHHLVVAEAKTRLRGIGTKAAPLVVGRTRAEAQGIIDSHITGALEDIAAGRSAPADVGAPAKAHRQRVGRPRAKAKPRGKRRAR